MICTPRAIVASLVLLLLAPALGSAQMPGVGRSSRPIRFVVSGGATVPTGDFEKFHDLGIHADASVLLNFAGLPLRLRPEVSFTKLNLKDSLATGGGLYGGGAGSSQMLGGFGNIEIPLGMGPLQFYVLAGVGALNLKSDATTTTTGDSYSSMKFAIDGGAGLRFRLGGIEGFLEGRLNSVFTDEGTLDFKDVRVIPVTFGLVFS